LIVRAHYCGHRVASLYVGASNVRRYFSRRLRFVELQLDNLRILCGLPEHFWQDKPEIEDARLCVWLETRHPQPDPFQREIPLALIPAGKNSFKITALDQMAHARLNSRADFIRSNLKTAQTQVM
jgi:hypothetical protein